MFAACQGRIEGWGVMRLHPWRLVGIFQDRALADARAARMGPQFIVRYGEGWGGSDRFVVSEMQDQDRLL